MYKAGAKKLEENVFLEQINQIILKQVLIQNLQNKDMLNFIQVKMRNFKTKKMKDKLKIIIAIGIFLFATIVSQAQNEFPRDTTYNIKSNYQKQVKYYPQVTPITNIKSDKFLSLWNQTYRIRNNRNLRMDIFIPNRETHKKHAAVLLVHGGGWRSGDKANLVPLAQQLAEKGYVCASVEQRLSLEAQYPAAVYDLNEAIRFLKHNANLYSIDTTKIAVLGASSGATMASLMATTGNTNKFQDTTTIYPNHTAEVHALINIDGVVTFVTPEETGRTEEEGLKRPGTWFLGATYISNPDLWEEASALNYAGKHTPPCLFINSSHTRFGFGRDTLFSVLDKYGIYHEHYTLENSPHAFWLLNPWFQPTVEYTQNFLDKIFKNK